LDNNHPYDSAQEAYRHIFDRVNKIGMWKKNPWVWVLDFDVRVGEDDEEE